MFQFLSSNYVYNQQRVLSNDLYEDVYFAVPRRAIFRQIFGK